MRKQNRIRFGCLVVGITFGTCTTKFKKSVGISYNVWLTSGTKTYPRTDLFSPQRIQPHSSFKVPHM